MKTLPLEGEGRVGVFGRFAIQRRNPSPGSGAALATLSLRERGFFFGLRAKPAIGHSFAS